MPAFFSNRLDNNSPTDTFGTSNTTTITRTSSPIYFVVTRTGETTTTTMELPWNAPPARTYQTLPLPLPSAELKRLMRLERLKDQINQLRKDLLKALRSDRALSDMRSVVPGKLPPRHHPLEHARRSFQQMARIPCYRGVRTR